MTYDNGMARLIQGDCHALLSEIEFDSILTDPPYGKGETYGGLVSDSVENLRANVEWLLSFNKPLILTVPVLRLWDVPRPQWVAVWEKPMSFGFWATPLLPHWEPILLYNMGKEKPLVQDIFVANTEKPNGHPAPKPLSLWKSLIQLLPGTVADPFCGSGTTLVAAHELGRKAVGIELNPDYCELAKSRLSQGVLL